MYEQTSAQGSGYANSNFQNQVPAVRIAEQPSILDGFGKSVSDAASQVAELSMRARSIADSVFGTMPEGAGTGSKDPQASGKASAVEREVRNLFDAISALRTQIDRLTCI